jgi:hypothetical protein
MIPDNIQYTFVTTNLNFNINESFFFFFVVLGFELRALCLFYCLNHISSTFFSGCYGDRVSHFAQSSLGHDPLDLSLLQSLG